ncbi:MAG: putative metal-binding motif-containing protein [Saprospiraceae bacterium]|nr:putative metal-binding motif-containing protein [Saprospiraceae bacterium]
MCGISSSTIVRNYGTFNWYSGDINPTGPYSCYYGAPPPAFLYIEAGGTLNIQAVTDINLGYTQIHNYGVVNKPNANTLTLSAACAGSPFYNYPGATFNLSFGQLVLYSGGSLQGIVNIGGILTINSAIDLGGQVSLTGSLYNNGTITSLAGLVISGNGYFNNTGLLNLISDVSFPFDIENTGTIGGSGIKTYLSGIEVNMNAGALSGNEHVFASGSTLNVNAVCGISSSTIVRNYGTFNWYSGDINPTGPYSCYYGAPPPAFLYIEAGGTLNIQAVTDINLGYTQIHNYGVVNKPNANTLTLSAACAGSPFYNYPGATFNLSFGQLVLYSGGSLQGIVNIGGILTINSAIDLGGQVSLTGSLYNNGTITSLAGLVISGNGYFNNTGLLNLISDVSFPFDIENTGTIGGSGIKTYLSGIEVNMNAGALSGNEHVFASGSTLNVNAVCGISGSTIVRNHGTFNWNGGDINPTGPYSCYYGSGPAAVLINEMAGVMNVNINSDVLLGYTAVTNHGTIHLNTEFIWDFTSPGGCVPSSFNNSTTGMISGTGGMKFTASYTFENGGSLQPGDSPGRITFHNNLDFGGSNYDCEINGSNPVSGYDVLKTTGNASIGNTVLNIDWNNYIPLQGEQFHVLSCGSRTGQFAGENIPAISGKIFNVVYGDTSVYITVTDVVTYYLDGDGDQYGLASVSMQSAMPIPGYVTQAGDCNDTDPSIHPNTTEICDGLDNNCDNLVDEGVLTTFFGDADGDGYGDPFTSVQACTLPMSFVNNDDDCDDENAEIHPQAVEVCDGLDNDCDGEIDEGVLTLYFADADGDGYGNAQISMEACSATGGYVANDDDCNDGEVGIHPGAMEVCDGLDNNCDGNIDEGATTTFLPMPTVTVSETPESVLQRVRHLQAMLKMMMIVMMTIRM